MQHSVRNIRVNSVHPVAIRCKTYSIPFMSLDFPQSSNVKGMHYLRRAYFYWHTTTLPAWRRSNIVKYLYFDLQENTYRFWLAHAHRDDVVSMYHVVLT